jgi:CDP-diacylglycerol---serine O-phosphatidyltransferase
VNNPSPPRKRYRSSKRRRFPFHFELSKAMFVLPNLFTLSSLLCGLYAILFVSAQPDAENLNKACLAIFFGAFFDGADGRIARLTKTQSAFGAELDSLADIVTFGIAPAMIAYHWGLNLLGVPGLFIAFTYVACGAIRLARFNVMSRFETEPSHFFLGIPIPLAAGVLVSFILSEQATFLLNNEWKAGIGLVLTLGISALMVSNVRYRNFKHVHLTKTLLIILASLMLAFAALSIWFRPILAVFALFLGYTLWGLCEAGIKKGSRSCPH